MITQLQAQSIIQANEQFWTQMLAMHLAPQSDTTDLQLPGGHIVAGIGMSGPWQGTIAMRLGKGLAREATAAMMMQTVEEVQESDILDATREIVNMVAGVLKSSLPRGCVMTLPESRVEGASFRRNRGNAVSVSVAFTHPAGALLVEAVELETML